MSNGQAAEATLGTMRIDAAKAIETISDLRKRLYQIRWDAEGFRKTPEGARCARELSLLITEAQSARHWGGECLSHFPTGYRVTDNPNDPGSESKAA